MNDMRGRWFNFETLILDVIADILTARVIFKKLLYIRNFEKYILTAMYVYIFETKIQKIYRNCSTA